MDRGTVALILAVVAVVGVIALAVVVLNQPSGPPVELKDARIESVEPYESFGEGYYYVRMYIDVSGDTSVNIVYKDGTVLRSFNVYAKSHLYGNAVRHPDGLVLTADDLRITL